MDIYLDLITRGDIMNFILYEDEEVFVNIYEEVINKLMLNHRIDYKIHKINSYDDTTINNINSIKGNKVFILDVEVPGKNGIDLARKIRKSGDWISPIIVVTSHEEFKVVGFTGKILMLDFISKNKELSNNLLSALLVSLEINSSKPSYNFSYKGDYFSLPYDDIIYFEKSFKDNSSIVVCENDDYVVRKTISEIEEELKNTNFFKTHRSCIVNLNKIKRINYDDGIIYFNNEEIDLLSRNNKKILKEKMEKLNGSTS